MLLPLQEITSELHRCGSIWTSIVGAGKLNSGLLVRQVPHLLSHHHGSSNPFQMSFAVYDGLFTLPAGGFSFQFESQGLIPPGPVVGRGQVSQWELQAGLCLYSVSGMSFKRQQLLLCLLLLDL